LAGDRFQGHHIPVFSEEKEVAMATEQVFEEEFSYHLLFKPLVSPPPRTGRIKLDREVPKAVGRQGTVRGNRMSGTICMTRSGATAGYQDE
jgi:hypothetical protein